MNPCLFVNQSNIAWRQLLLPIIVSVILVHMMFNTPCGNLYLHLRANTFQFTCSQFVRSHSKQSVSDKRPIYMCRKLYISNCGINTYNLNVRLRNLLAQLLAASLWLPLFVNMDSCSALRMICNWVWFKAWRRRHETREKYSGWMKSCQAYWITLYMRKQWRNKPTC